MPSEQLAPREEYYNGQTEKEINYTFRRNRCKTGAVDLLARERQVKEWVDFVNQALACMGNSLSFLSR
jgi:hypothetical protein